MAYVIELTDSAERELKRLSLPARVAVSRALDRLALNPRRPGIRKVVGQHNLYRAKAGDYRIIFALQERHVRVVVVRVAHRARVYRQLDSLPPGWDYGLRPLQCVPHFESRAALVFKVLAASKVLPPTPPQRRARSRTHRCGRRAR